MKNLTQTNLKTFFYNLITFDFIFLSPLNKKRSNFHIEQTVFSKNKFYFRLSLFELLNSFKLFIRFFQFLSKKSKIKNYRTQILLYIWSGSFQNIKFLNFFFKKYKLDISFDIIHLFPQVSNKFKFFKNILVLDHKLTKNDYKNFFLRNLYLIQKINVFHETMGWGSYKIYNNLNDIKKLIFISLILIQVFKK